MVVVAGLYASVIYLSILAYMVIIGEGVGMVLVLGPILISGLIAAIIAADLLIGWAVRRLRWAWLALSTVRLRRSRGAPTA